jgi:hypothetical protein
LIVQPTEQEVDMKSIRTLGVVKSILMIFTVTSPSTVIDPLKLAEIFKAAEEMVSLVDYRDTPDTPKYVVG